MKGNLSTYLIGGILLAGTAAAYYFAAGRDRYYFSSIEPRDNKEAARLQVANVNKAEITKASAVSSFVKRNLGVGQQVRLHRPDGKIVNKAPISRLSGRLLTLGIKFNALDKKMRRNGGYLTVG